MVRGRSTKRKIKTGAAPKGSAGEPLCRFCFKEVKPPRRTFCGDACVHEWQLLTSPSYVRECVFKRDKGICAACGLDTKEITRGFSRPLKGETWEEWKIRTKTIRDLYSIPPHRTTFWDADHIISVVEGGGLCGLDNYQTLCLACHKKKTAELARSRAGKKLKRKRKRKSK